MSKELEKVEADDLKCLSPAIKNGLWNFTGDTESERMMAQTVLRMLKHGENFSPMTSNCFLSAPSCLVDNARGLAKIQSLGYVIIEELEKPLTVNGDECKHAMFITRKGLDAMKTNLRIVTNP